MVLTHSDIYFSQVVCFPTKSTSKPEKLLSCFLCPYWRFIHCRPVLQKRKWDRGGVWVSGLACAVSAKCQRREREVEKSIFYFILKCFLYLSITQCPVVVFAVCNLHLFLTNSTGKHFSIVLFLGYWFFCFLFFVSFFFLFSFWSHVLCLTYFWEQVVLIYAEFITRKECFLNASLLLGPHFQNTHACTLCSVVVMKKHFLVFSIKSRSLGRKQSENMNMTANRKKQT